MMLNKQPYTSYTAYHPVTRWLHAGLVLGVLFQLLCAAFMTHPEHQSSNSAHHAIEQYHQKDAAYGKFFMTAHKTGGIIIALIVLMNFFWACILRGSPKKRQIMVLLSKTSWIRAIKTATQLPSIINKNTPVPLPGNELSRIVEMLGLIIMLGMAITGSFIWFLWPSENLLPISEMELLMQTHAFIALLLFLYLLSHIALVIIHTRAGHLVFSRISPLQHKHKHNTEVYDGY